MVDDRSERKSFFRYDLFAWGTLGYNIFVILWGAFVRATGSGAGCGSHWPLCNGDVIPKEPRLETIIEFAHRATSGVSLILVAILLIWGWRRYPKGHPVRFGAGLSMFFIFTEALVGAGLVLFRWVANDASSGRVVSVAVHLLNTFLLLAALTITTWWASGGGTISLRKQGWVLWLMVVGFIGVLFLGVSGAINALGDTLFPVSSFAEGLAQDFSPTAHFLLRLRVFHPLFAVIIGFYLMLLGLLFFLFIEGKVVKKLSLGIVGLFILQLLAGLMNLFLLAPVWMQIVHLFLADVVWITLVLLAAALFSRKENMVEYGNGSR